MGGKLHIYKRENSRHWQRSTYLAGKNWRKTTKEESLVHAKDIAEDWYLELPGAVSLNHVIKRFISSGTLADAGASKCTIRLWIGAETTCMASACVR